MAGRLEFLAAEFALHRRNPRFPTFRCFPCFRRLNPRGEIGTAPEATGRGCTRGPPPWYRSQMPNVLNGIELGLMVCSPASSARACSSVLSLFILLQMR